jgi:hypothetical protein
MTQQQALDILKLGYNVYITGAAGSGKTHLLNQYIAYLKEHDVDVGITASTGIAATHMGGMTIHSWTGLGIKSHLSDYDIDALLEKKYLHKKITAAKVLIIDEISMLHDFRLDMVDQILRAFKGNSLPFGGVQLILCGDFFQLPPVTRIDEPESNFVYHSAAWKNARLKICYLEEQFRQTDDHALTVLNSIRTNTVTSEIRKHLEASLVANKKTRVPATHLYTHNADVDGVNYTALENLEGRVVSYPMTSNGNEVLVSMLKKSCLAPEQLRLKKGAEVMFVKNNFEKGYVNGTLGEVVTLNGENGGPIVRIHQSGKQIEVDRESWRIEEEGVKKAEIMQYPLRLAWAITVHKSQGMSLDAVVVDLSKSFERGMGYVALSRVRTLAGLTILGMNEEALKVNDEVLEYDESLKARSKKAVGELESLNTTEMHDQQKEYIKSISPVKTKKDPKRATHEITRDLLADELSLAAIAEKRGMTEQTIITHLEKLVEEDKKNIQDMVYLKKYIPRKHFEVISDALLLNYEKKKNWNLSPVKDYLDKTKKAHRLSPQPSYRDIQLVRIFVKAEL